MTSSSGALGAIGNTPVVRLDRLVEPGMVATVLVDSGLKYLGGEIYA